MSDTWLRRNKSGQIYFLSNYSCNQNQTFSRLAWKSISWWRLFISELCQCKNLTNRFIGGPYIRYCVKVVSIEIVTQYNLSYLSTLFELVLDEATCNKHSKTYIYRKSSHILMQPLQTNTHRYIVIDIP